MIFAGLDLGTSALKLMLMNEKGELLLSLRRSYPLTYPQPQWSEQEPQDWWTACRELLQEASARIAPEKIAAIGVGGQMHGLVILDERDAVIRPAILWNDGRTGAETRYLLEQIGTEQLQNWTGNIAFAGFTAPKLLWLKKHEPEHFAQISKIMLPKDYVNYCLTGVHTTDFSDASGMLLLDVEQRTWSAPMLEICGIHEGQLPKLHESYEVVGRVQAALAAELGLVQNCVVVAGAGDNAAAAIGMGVVEDLDCNISLGTSGTLFVATDHYGKVSNPSLHAFCHANGAYHLMGVMLTAAAANQWWMEDILGTSDYEGEQERIEALGESALYFMPYLMGERTPHNDEAVKGAFIGLSLTTTRAQMTEAVLEAVAFGLRDALEIARELGLTIERSKICGGGAKSPLWRKIIANVLGLALERMETDEGPALGAAILAAVGAGAYPDVASACRGLPAKAAGDAAEPVKSRAVEYPEPRLQALYEKKYQRYRCLYPLLKDFYRTELAASELPLQ